MAATALVAPFGVALGVAVEEAFAGVAFAEGTRVRVEARVAMWTSKMQDKREERARKLGAGAKYKIEREEDELWRWRLHPLVFISGEERPRTPLVPKHRPVNAAMRLPNPKGAVQE